MDQESTPWDLLSDSSRTFESTNLLIHRGYVDDSAKPEERQHTGLHDALDSLLANKDVAVTTTKAFGCTIKFKPAA